MHTSETDYLLLISISISYVFSNYNLWGIEFYSSVITKSVNNEIKSLSNEFIYLAFTTK